MYSKVWHSALTVIGWHEHNRCIVLGWLEIGHEMTLDGCWDFRL